MKPIRVLSLAALALTAQLHAKTLQVFILAGQSNMQGHAKVSTFEHIGMDPATKPMLDEMVGADGTPKVCERVWISSLGSADEEKIGKLTAGFGASQNGPKIGPEFTFGLYMQKFMDAPILIIKTAWGGKSLNTDFRSPSAGPFVFKNEIKERAKKLAKESELKPAEEKALMDKLRGEGLTERERLVLEKGISNFEFHYLGSAKILGGVGKGFAEAMVTLRNSPQCLPIMSS